MCAIVLGPKNARINISELATFFMQIFIFVSMYAKYGDICSHDTISDHKRDSGVEQRGSSLHYHRASDLVYINYKRELSGPTILTLRLHIHTSVCNNGSDHPKILS